MDISQGMNQNYLIQLPFFAVQVYIQIQIREMRSSFGTSRRIPQQFNEYLSILSGMETILEDLSTKVQLVMQDHFQQYPASEIEQQQAIDISHAYAQHLRAKFRIVVDKLDLFIKNKFEDSYIHYRRQYQRKQIRQQCKRTINLENLEAFNSKNVANQNRLRADFNEYFDAFLEKLNEDMAQYMTDKGDDPAIDACLVEFESEMARCQAVIDESSYKL